jgi:hypothetical protein
MEIGILQVFVFNDDITYSKTVCSSCMNIAKPDIDLLLSKDRAVSSTTATNFLDS